VCLVASGEMHSVAVNDAGRIFTWGDNRFSQLGRQTPSEVTSSAPKLVNSSPAIAEQTESILFFLNMSAYTAC